MKNKNSQNKTSNSLKIEENTSFTIINTTNNSNTINTNNKSNSTNNSNSFLNNTYFWIIILFNSIVLAIISLFISSNSLQDKLIYNLYQPKICLKDLLERKENVFKTYTSIDEFIENPSLGNSTFMSYDEHAFLKYSLDNIFQYIKLLYKATRDGFGGRDFHRMVNGHPNTLTIITTENGHRFGAFTPVEFRSSNDNYSFYKKDSSLKSFIFSLDNKTKFTLKLDNQYTAIYDSFNFGPSFGDNDILICDNSNINSCSFSNLLDSFENKSLNMKYRSEDAHSYLAGNEFLNNYFKTAEIEVYQLI